MKGVDGTAQAACVIQIVGFGCVAQYGTAVRKTFDTAKPSRSRQEHRERTRRSQVRVLSHPSLNYVKNGGICNVVSTNGTAVPPNGLFKDPKELRYRKLYFPDADKLAFNTSRKGFIPLPILLRKVIRHLSTPEFRVLVYLHLRAGRFGVCYPSPQEMVYELGLGSTKNLTPYLHSLEQKKLISSKDVLGKMYYLVHDPRVALEHLIQEGTITGAELDSVNELCTDLGQAAI